MPEKPERDILPRDPVNPLLKESPNQLSEDSLEEAELKEFHLLFMTILDKFLKAFWKMLSEMPLLIPSMPEEKQSLLWMSSMPLRDKDVLCTDSVDEQTILLNN